MQTHRIISGLTIFVMVVLVAAGWLLVAQPQLAAADTANKSLGDAQAQIATTKATLASLKTEQEKLPALKSQLAALKMAIPSDIDSSAYIRGLNDLAATAGVTITAITVTSPQAYAAPVAAAPPVAATGNPSASPSASASAAPTPVPTPSAGTGWTPPTDPLITAANFVAIPVTVDIAGPWGNSLSFIKGLQTGTRLFLVTGVKTKQDEGNTSAVDANISGLIYALIDPKDAAAQAAAQKAAPTPTPTVSVTPSPAGSVSPTPTPTE